MFKKFVEVFKPREFIFWEGDEAEHFYVILEGEVEIRRVNIAGNQLLIANLGPGDFFGEMALLNKLPRTATAKACKLTKLLVLTKEKLLKVIQKDTKFTLKMIKMLCQRLKKLDDVFINI